MTYQKAMRRAACTVAILLGLAAAAGAQTVETGTPAPPGKLRLATCQFPVSGDIAANADWIRCQIRDAHDRDADLVHFPERP